MMRDICALLCTASPFFSNSEIPSGPAAGRAGTQEHRLSVRPEVRRPARRSGIAEAPEGSGSSPAGPEVPRAQSIAELLELDTFTVLSQGIAYRNEGAGYFEGSYLYNLALPSGERVAARIHTESVQDGEKFASGEVVLPVGRVIWADLEEDPAFLEQITSGYPLDRTDFYVDMAGEAVRYSQEERTENHVIVVQLVTVLVCFPLLHALGSRSGIFPAFFPTVRREKAGRN